MAKRKAKTEGDRLREACDADPGDTAASLVYADWLDEQGREAEAYGRRWAAAHGKVPGKRAHGYGTRRRQVLAWGRGTWDGLGRTDVSTRQNCVHWILFEANSPAMSRPRKLASPLYLALGTALLKLKAIASLPAHPKA